MAKQKISIEDQLKQEAGDVCDQLDAYFDSFHNDFRAASHLETDFCPRTMQNVAVSFVHDLHRYRAYHQVDIPDSVRRAAYLCKWLTKLRPISVRTEWTKGVGDYYLMANELFALHVAGGILDIDFESESNPRMMNILLYSLRYRASEDTFILYFGKLSGLE
jgi:hypothetical protein